jgi:hypothetical protein
VREAAIAHVVELAWIPRKKGLLFQLASERHHRSRDQAIAIATIEKVAVVLEYAEGALHLKVHPSRVTRVSSTTQENHGQTC